MNDIPTRVAVLEKDMGQVKSDMGQIKSSLAKLFIWFTVAVAVGSPLFGGLLGVIAWNATRSVNQLDSLSAGVGDIKTDMAVVKSKQQTGDTGQVLEADHAVVKRGGLPMCQKLSTMSRCVR